MQAVEPPVRAKPDAKLRVLFVDDEPQVLHGLRDMLRKKRKVWDMTFVPGGEEALELLRTQSYDVLVSDMRMPGVDGATLLQFAHENHPKMIRIILSGHTEMEAAMRVVPVAHQFVMKPCSPQGLASVITRAQKTQQLITDDDIRFFCGRMSQLPVLPSSYNALSKALVDENTGAPEVAKILADDIGMTAKVLQLSNSAFFRVSRRITKVEDAVVYLGFQTIKNLVMSVGVFSEAVLDDCEELRACYQKSMAVAAVSADLATSKEMKDDAFMAGMLHEIGLLVLASQLPDFYADARRLADERQASIRDVFRSDFNVSVSEIGAYLLGLWGIPYPIIEAVAHCRHPHNVEPQDEPSVLSCVAIAHDMVEAVRSEKDPLEAVDHAYVARLKVAPRQLERASYMAVDALQAAGEAP